MYSKLHFWMSYSTSPPAYHSSPVSESYCPEKCRQQRAKRRGLGSVLTLGSSTAKVIEEKEIASRAVLASQPVCASHHLPLVHVLEDVSQTPLSEVNEGGIGVILFLLALSSSLPSPNKMAGKGRITLSFDPGKSGSYGNHEPEKQGSGNGWGLSNLYTESLLLLPSCPVVSDSVLEFTGR